MGVFSGRVFFWEGFSRPNQSPSPWGGGGLGCQMLQPAPPPRGDRGAGDPFACAQDLVGVLLGDAVAFAAVGIRKDPQGGVHEVLALPHPDLCVPTLFPFFLESGNPPFQGISSILFFLPLL